jgi:dihydroorotate dehydrogenase (NAD+) catalytic subunit
VYASIIDVAENKYYQLLLLISAKILMVSIETELCGVSLDNPTVLAAGILGCSPYSLRRVAESGAGAVTTKSIGPNRRDGHNNPIIVEVEGGYLNAVGLPTPGPDDGIKEIKEFKGVCNKPIIASFYASKLEDFAPLAEKISSAEPALLEVNISCPNVQSEFGVPFACEVDSAESVIKSVKKATSIPLLVKLSPNVPSIAMIGKTVEKAGADGLVAINTVGPGMVIDLESRAPVLANKRGGMSGPAIKPIAVRCIYDLFEVVDIPILGTGGVLGGRDAAEMIMAGASAVGIGTGIRYMGLDVFGLVAEELREFMVNESFKSITELRGCVRG